MWQVISRGIRGLSRTRVQQDNNDTYRGLSNVYKSQPLKNLCDFNVQLENVQIAQQSSMGQRETISLERNSTGQWTPLPNHN